MTGTDTAGAGPEEAPVEPGAATVGVHALHDVAVLGEQLAGRVLEHELARRLPRAALDLVAPVGWHRAHPLDGGRVARPVATGGTGAVGARGTGAVALTGTLPDVATAKRWYGGEVPDGPRLEVLAGAAAQVVLWLGVTVPDGGAPGVGAAGRAPLVVVTDDDSRRRVGEAAPDAPAEVAAHPALLASRLVPEHVLARRLRYLQALEVWPDDGQPVALVDLAGLAAALGTPGPGLDAAGERALADLAGRVAAAVRHAGSAPVLAHTEPEDAAGLAARVAAVAAAPALAHHTGCEDLLAALAAAELVVTGSGATAAAALGLGRPVVAVGSDPVLGTLARVTSSSAGGALTVAGVRELPELAGRRPPAGLRGAEATAHATDGLDTLLDRAGELLGEASPAPGAETGAERTARLADELAAVRRAHAARGRQLDRERMLFADQVDLRAADLRARAVAAEDRAARAEAALAAFQANRLYRWTGPLRRTWSLVRRVRGRP